MVYKNKRYLIRVMPDPENPLIIDLVGEKFVDVLRVKDIGEGGLSVYIPYQFNRCVINREIELVVTLPGAWSFKARGNIKHKEETPGDYFGISFTHIEEQDMEKVKEYIRMRADEGHVV